MSVTGLSSLTLETCASVHAIPQRDWQRLAGHSNPFLRQEFFQAAFIGIFRNAIGRMLTYRQMLQSRQGVRSLCSFL